MDQDENLLLNLIDEVTRPIDSDEGEDAQEDDIDMDLFMDAEDDAGLQEHSMKFVEETVPRLNAEQFKEQFRLSPTTVDRVLQLVDAPHGEPATAVPLRKKLLLLLWYLGSVVSFRKVAMVFGLSLGAAWSAVDEVLGLLVALTGSVIRMPSMGGFNEIMTRFRMKGVRGAIGAVDGCHIRIIRPHEDDQAYVNRKGYHSICLMAVVDDRGRFIDICVGWPGSVHDSRVFKNSPLGRHLAMDGYRAQHIPDEAFIIGDAAFQLTTYLLTPFRDNQLRIQRAGEPTPQQKKHYNKVLSGARVVVEHTFGVLKSRFRRLFLVETKSVENAVRVVTAACVLHNICAMNDDDFEELGMLEDVNDVEDMDEFPDGGAVGGGAAAVQKRFRVVEDMWVAR